MRRSGSPEPRSVARFRVSVTSTESSSIREPPAARPRAPLGDLSVRAAAARPKRRPRQPTPRSTATGAERRRDGPVLTAPGSSARRHLLREDEAPCGKSLRLHGACAGAVTWAGAPRRPAVDRTGADRGRSRRRRRPSPGRSSDERPSSPERDIRPAASAPSVALAPMRILLSRPRRQSAARAASNRSVRTRSSCSSMASQAARRALTSAWPSGPLRDPACEGRVRSSATRSDASGPRRTPRCARLRSVHRGFARTGAARLVARCQATAMTAYSRASVLARAAAKRVQRVATLGAHLAGSFGAHGAPRAMRRADAVRQDRARTMRPRSVRGAAAATLPAVLGVGTVDYLLPGSPCAAGPAIARTPSVIAAWSRRLAVGGGRRGRGMARQVRPLVSDRPLRCSRRSTPAPA